MLSNFWILAHFGVWCLGGSSNFHSQKLLILDKLVGLNDLLNVKTNQRVRRVNGLKDKGEATIGDNLLFELLMGNV